MQEYEDLIYSQLDKYGDFRQLLDREYITKGVALFALMLIIGWWGLALYTYFRRAYFEPEIEAEAENGKFEQPA